MVDEVLAKAQRGRRRGWTWGGLGGVLWLPIMAGVIGVQGHLFAAMLALLFFGVGVAYVVMLAPWKFPATPVSVIYLGLVAIIVSAAAALLWLLVPPQVNLGQKLYTLLPLVSLVMPVLIFRRRTWEEIGPVLINRDGDRCG